ncbi:c-type cytochrome [Nitrogeniibacter mangrovi]|uniref:C-type cytochrome n=1 Tax=Nitrogeniibacter mangrovi TaxID=2016596 RepID=A0A6C1B845_9RHOO|nr:c-type cytochrome [Nitrogeniibacter mangrovi]QID19109.1 c-type cytochrome [Nitrogeniibacter mangrovi]
MKKTMLKLAPLALVGLLAAPASHAADGATLYQEVGCSACHAVDQKRMGPMYKEVAAKYKGQADAEAHLFKKVREGGAGVWGQIPMPPNPESRVTDEELHTIIKWILSL